MLHLSYKDANVMTSPVRSRLCFDIEVRFQDTTERRTPLEITNVVGEFHVISKDASVWYVGPLVSDGVMYRLNSNVSMGMRMMFDPGPYELTKLETVRNGGDLKFRIFLRCLTTVKIDNFSEEFGPYIDGKIPKSDWVERHLPLLHFSEFSLIEVPKLHVPELEKAVAYVSEAWKQYGLGEYDKSLTECRKSLEALGGELKAKGFETEASDPQTGKAKRVVDWKRLLDDHRGECIGPIFQKLHSFVDPSAHPAPFPDRSDAIFSILCTQSIIQLVSRRVSR